MSEYNSNIDNGPIIRAMFVSTSDAATTYNYTSNVSNGPVIRAIKVDSNGTPI